MPAIESREQDHQTTLDSSAHSSSTTPDRGNGGSSAGSIARKVGLVVVLGAAAGFAYWKIQGNQQENTDTANRTLQQANRAIPVTTATVASRTMPIYLSELGTVTAYNTVTIKSRVDGQLLSVNVREGQQVKQGQVLAMIDPKPYEATVAQAEGQLAKDQATADYAKAEAGRYTALFQAGVVSKDSQQVQQTSAGQSAGVLDADRAQIQAAKVNLGYTRIASPISGVVGLRQVDAGNIVHASDANGLLVVTQLQPISVIFTLPEDQLPIVMKTMKGGRKLVVDAYDRSDALKLATGSLVTLDNQIDTTTGTVKAKAVFDNKDGALYPNQFVNVRLILEQRENSLVIPAAALQNGANGAYVYLLKKGVPPKQAGDDEGAGGAPGGGPKPAGKPVARPAGGAPGGLGAGGDPADAAPRDPYYVDVQEVAVDVTEGNQVILKSGLKAGDQIVVDGQEKLKKFSKVDPKAAAPRPGGRGGAGAAGGAAGGRSGGGNGAAAGAAATDGSAPAADGAGAGRPDGQGRGGQGPGGQGPRGQGRDGQGKPGAQQ